MIDIFKVIFQFFWDVITIPINIDGFEITIWAVFLTAVLFAIIVKFIFGSSKKGE